MRGASHQLVSDGQAQQVRKAKARRFARLGSQKRDVLSPTPHRLYRHVRKGAHLILCELNGGGCRHSRDRQLKTSISSHAVSFAAKSTRMTGGYLPATARQFYAIDVDRDRGLNSSQDLGDITKNIVTDQLPNR